MPKVTQLINGRARNRQPVPCPRPVSFVYIVAFTLWVSISVGLRGELGAGLVMEGKGPWPRPREATPLARGHF